MKNNRLNDYDHIRKSINRDMSKSVFTPRRFAPHQLDLTPGNLNNYLESGVWYNTLSEATNVLQLMQTVSEMVNDKKRVSESAMIDTVNRFLLNRHIVKDWANVYKVNENSKFDLHEKFTSFLEYTNELSYDVHVYDAINDKLNIEGVLFDVVSKNRPVESMRLMDELLDKIEDSGLIKGDKSREGVLFLIDHFAGKKKIIPVDKEYLIDLANVYYFMHHKETLELPEKPQYTPKSILVLGNSEVVKFKDNKIDNTRIVCSILSIFTKYLPELSNDFVIFLDGLCREINEKKILVNKQFVELFMNSVPYVSTPEMDDVCGEIIDLINPDTYNIVYKPAVGDTTLEDFLHAFVDGKIDKVALSKLISDFSETDKMEFEYILDIIGNPSFLDKVKDAYGYDADNNDDIYIKQARVLYILTGLHLSQGDNPICVRLAINMMGMIAELLSHCDMLKDDVKQNFSEYNLTMSKIYTQTHGYNVELDKEVDETIDKIDVALLKNSGKLEKVDEVSSTPYVGLPKLPLENEEVQDICTTLVNAHSGKYEGDTAVLFFVNQLNIIYGYESPESVYKILKSYLDIISILCTKTIVCVGLLNAFKMLINKIGVNALAPYMKYLINSYANAINRVNKNASKYNLGVDEYIAYCDELIEKCNSLGIDTGINIVTRTISAIRALCQNPNSQFNTDDIGFLKHYTTERLTSVVDIDNIDEAIAYVVIFINMGTEEIVDDYIHKIIQFINNSDYRIDNIYSLYYATLILRGRSNLSVIDRLLDAISLNIKKNPAIKVSESVDDPFDNDYFNIDKDKKKKDEKSKDDKDEKKSSKNKKDSKKVEDDEDIDEDEDIDDDFDEEDWDDDDWETYNEDPDKAVKETFDPNVDRIMVAALLEAELAKNQYRYYRKGQMRLFTLSPSEKIRMGLNNNINESIDPYTIMKQHVDIYLTNYDRIMESEAIGFIHEKSNKTNGDKEDGSITGKISKTAKAISKKATNVVKKSHELGQKTSDNFQQFAADFNIIKRQAASAFQKVGDIDKKYSDKVDTLFDRSYMKLKKNVANKNREAILKGSLLPSLSSLIKLGTAAGALTALGQPILGLVTLVGGVGMSAKATKEERQAIADELDVQQKIVEKRLVIADNDNDIESYGMLLKIKNRILKEKARLTYKTNNARAAMRKAEWDKHSNMD